MPDINWKASNVFPLGKMSTLGVWMCVCVRACAHKSDFCH